jgi:LCP family protein required for cell wall assembly
MSRRGTHKNVSLICVILILVLVMIYSGLQILESTVLSSQEEQEQRPTKTITRDGVEYFPRQDVTVYLLMGIDQLGPMESSGFYRNFGEADVITLLVMDHTNKSYQILCLNRDTMVSMPALGIGGRPAGKFFGQLALSHTYGDGLEDSCENTRQTVSEFLYNIKIDQYVALNMDAISIVTDAVDGVTVTVTDDFSAVEPSLGKGEVTLTGEQALTFVRSRTDVGNQLNLSRMERHKEYMRGLTAALNKKLDSSDSFALKLYDKLSDYMVTDCSANVLSGLMNRCAEYELEQILSLEGENVRGKEFYEFYPDEKAMDALILQMFYAPKK